MACSSTDQASPPLAPLSRQRLLCSPLAGGDGAVHRPVGVRRRSPRSPRRTAPPAGAASRRTTSTHPARSTRRSSRASIALRAQHRSWNCGLLGSPQARTAPPACRVQRPGRVRPPSAPREFARPHPARTPSTHPDSRRVASCRTSYRSAPSVNVACPDRPSSRQNGSSVDSDELGDHARRHPLGRAGSALPAAPGSNSMVVSRCGGRPPRRRPLRPRRRVGVHAHAVPARARSVVPPSTRRTRSPRSVGQPQRDLLRAADETVLLVAAVGADQRVQPTAGGDVEEPVQQRQLGRLGGRAPL